MYGNDTLIAFDTRSGAVMWEWTWKPAADVGFEIDREALDAWHYIAAFEQGVYVATSWLLTSERRVDVALLGSDGKVLYHATGPRTRLLYSDGLSRGVRA
jgi:hypothetical protein